MCAGCASEHWAWVAVYWPWNVGALANMQAVRPPCCCITLGPTGCIFALPASSVAAAGACAQCVLAVLAACVCLWLAAVRPCRLHLVPTEVPEHHLRQAPNCSAASGTSAAAVRSVLSCVWVLHHVSLHLHASTSSRSLVSRWVALQAATGTGTQPGTNMNMNVKMVDQHCQRSLLGVCAKHQYRLHKIIRSGDWSMVKMLRGPSHSLPCAVALLLLLLSRPLLSRC